MIWLPTLELLLRIAIGLLIAITIIHAVWSAVLVMSYLEDSEPYTKADCRWLRRTIYLIVVLVIACLTQKFFRDNSIPLDMFLLSDPSESTCHGCKS